MSRTKAPRGPAPQHALSALGWTPTLEDERKALPPGWLPARVSIDYGSQVEVLSPEGTCLARLPGRARHKVTLSAELPAVGDWVAITPQPDGTAVVEHRFARRTRIQRRAAGKRAAPQVIAANIDTLFIVTTPNQDLSPRRLERYLATARDGGALPVVVINKIDLSTDPAALRKSLEPIVREGALALVSAATRTGLDELLPHFRPGASIALVGSSGVGKSTLVNWLFGHAVQAVGAVREDDDKGRHTTTHRQLLPIPPDSGAPAAGCILIDTPGMRELKLWVEEDGLDDSFDDVAHVAQGCRFTDCLHDGEPGCQVAVALGQGLLHADRVSSYRKLRAELNATDPIEVARQAKRKARVVGKVRRAHLRSKGGDD